MTRSRTRDFRMQEPSGLNGVGKSHRRIMLGVAAIASLGQHRARLADLAPQKVRKSTLSLPAQRHGARGDEFSRKLGHAGGRRAGPRRVGKYMQIGESTL